MKNFQIYKTAALNDSNFLRMQTVLCYHQKNTKRCRKINFIISSSRKLLSDFFFSSYVTKKKE